MTNPASPKPSRAGKSTGKIHLVRAGSVTLKIYQCHKKGRDYFTVSWHIGPRRHRQNFKTLDEARRFAKVEAEKLAAGQVNVPGLSVADAQTYQEAVRRLGPHRIPVHVVADEYARALEKLNNAGTLHQAVEYFVRNTARPELERTVLEVVEEMVRVKERNGLSQRYIEDVRNRLGRFAKDFRVPIGSVHTRDIGDWVRKLNCSPRSRNNFRNLIVTLFSFARKQGYWSADRVNPAINVDCAKVKSGPIQIFSPSELAEMLAAADGPPRLAIAFGAFAGIRQAEILRLRWENLNWEEQVIDLGSDQTKTAARRLAPLLPALAAWVYPHRQDRGKILPFEEDTGFHRIYKSMVERVNAARSPDQGPFRWKQNGLRHSFASYRLAMIEDVAKVSLEMGNSPQKIFSNYRKVVTKSQAAAWFAVMPEAPENVVPIGAVA
jgi:integrase